MARWLGKVVGPDGSKFEGTNISGLAGKARSRLAQGSPKVPPRLPKVPPKPWFGVAAGIILKEKACLFEKKKATVKYPYIVTVYPYTRI